MYSLSLFVVATVFATGAFGDGHGEYDVPMISVAIKIENDMFKFGAMLSQYFPDNGKASEIAGEISLMRQDGQQMMLSDVRAFMVWPGVDNCSAFDPEKEEYIYEYTSDIRTDNSTRVANVSRLTAVADESELDLIFGATYHTTVLQVNGENYCATPTVEEKNMKKIRIVFPFCTEFTTMALRETVGEVFGIDKDRVFVGKNMYEGGCYSADVYFQYTFMEPEILHKIRMALSSKSGLGRFSGTDKCMTNVRDTFITDTALGMCYDMWTSSQQQPAPLPTCAGVSSQLAQQYRQRIMKYDCLVEEYQKKYGVNAEGCMSRQQQQNTDQASCNCASDAESRVQNQMRILLQYVGAPLYFPELQAKKQELAAMMSGQMIDQARFAKLAEEIKQLETAQNDYYLTTYYGFCMVAGYGEGAMTKLDWVKSQVAARMEAEDIVKSILKESINYYLDTCAVFMDQEPEMRKQTMKLKVKMLLGVTNACSTMEEREMVWNTLMNMTKSFQQHVETFNTMVDNEKIANATRDVLAIVQENPEEIAMKMFLVLFSPMEVPEDNMLAAAVMKFFDVMQANKMHIVGKVKSWLNGADLMELMGLQVIFMSPEDTRKECNLAMLSGMVRPVVDAMSGNMDDAQTQPEDDQQNGGSARADRQYQQPGGS